MSKEGQLDDISRIAPGERGKVSQEQKKDNPREAITKAVTNLYKDYPPEVREAITTEVLKLYGEAEEHLQLETVAHEKVKEAVKQNNWELAGAATSVSSYFRDRRGDIIEKIYDLGGTPNQTKHPTTAEEGYRRFQNLVNRPPALISILRPTPKGS